MDPIAINPWQAIEFAINKIDDHFDRLEFLKHCQHGDMRSVAVEWPDFVAFCERADV